MRSLFCYCGYCTKLPLNNDYLSATATILGPEGGRCTQVWLYISFYLLKKQDSLLKMLFFNYSTFITISQLNSKKPMCYLGKKKDSKNAFLYFIQHNEVLSSMLSSRAFVRHKVYLSSSCKSRALRYKLFSLRP